MDYVADAIAGVAAFGSLGAWRRGRKTATKVDDVHRQTEMSNGTTLGQTVEGLVHTVRLGDRAFLAHARNGHGADKTAWQAARARRRRQGRPITSEELSRTRSRQVARDA